MSVPALPPSRHPALPEVTERLSRKAGLQELLLESYRLAGPVPPTG